MSYLHEQNRNGKIYVYEIHSYWDKKKQQSRQKRTYLGRKDAVSGKIKTKRKKVPIGSYTVGSLYLLKELCKQSKLLRVIKKVFPDEYEKILYLSCFKVIKKEPYYFYESWCEESYVSKNISMDSAEVSRFLHFLGRDERRIDYFFTEWIKEFKSPGAILFDITSISSYGSQNEFLERGYNRDGENLEQVNLGLIARTSCPGLAGLPLTYRIYPGSITDVTTLKNVIDLVDRYKLGLDVLVMDKGFYSQENIRGMHRQGLNYIVPLSFSTKKSEEILFDLHDKLLSPKSLFAFYEQVYSYSKKEIEIGGENCIAHVFVEGRRKSDQESVFIRKISDLEKLFLEKEFSNKDDAGLYLEETLKTKKKFFLIKEEGRRFIIERNIDIFQKEMMKMGCIILITNNVLMDRDEVLKLYRRKDCVEKVFRSFKHDIDEKRNRTHSLIAMRGSIFISFISLILISWIDHVMKEKKLYKKMAKAELYKILDRLRLYELNTGSPLLGEVSKKQKDIFKAFNVSKNLCPNRPLI